MPNLVSFILIIVLMIAAMFTGAQLHTPPPRQTAAKASQDSGVPSIGKIQVLNGCGINGAADAVAAYLRTQKFDVKSTDNAPHWNYPFTIVAARKNDLSIAQQVCNALRTRTLILLRTNDPTYDVTVFIGSDFGERIK